VALALLWELTSPEVWTSAVSSCNCKRQKEDQTLFILCPKSFLFGRGFRPHPCLPLIAQFLSLPEQLQFSGEGVYLVNFSSADEAEEAEEADTCPQKRPRKPNSPPDCIYILYLPNHLSVCLLFGVMHASGGFFGGFFHPFYGGEGRGARGRGVP